MLVLDYRVREGRGLVGGLAGALVLLAALGLAGWTATVTRREASIERLTGEIPAEVDARPLTPLPRRQRPAGFLYKPGPSYRP